MPKRLCLFYKNDAVMSANPIWFPDAKLVHLCNPLRFEVHSTLKSSCRRAYFNMENLWMAKADAPGGIRKPVIGSGNDSEKRENVKPNKVKILCQDKIRPCTKRKHISATRKTPHRYM